MKLVHSFSKPVYQQRNAFKVSGDIHLNGLAWEICGIFHSNEALDHKAAESLHFFFLFFGWGERLRVKHYGEQVNPPIKH